MDKFLIVAPLMEKANSIGRMQVQALFIPDMRELLLYSTYQGS